MSKEYLFQTFLIDLFVKGIYYVVRFYINITDCVGITCYWSKTTFIISLTKNIFLGKIVCKIFFVVTHLPHLLKLSVKALILLVLFEFKPLKFTLNLLTFSWRRPLSYRNQSIDLRSKSLDWFLYGNGLRHERVKWIFCRCDSLVVISMLKARSSEKLMGLKLM